MLLGTCRSLAEGRAGSAALYCGCSSTYMFANLQSSFGMASDSDNR